MTAGPAARIPRERLIVGDGLRAAAALSVLVYHSTQWLVIHRTQGVYTPLFGETAAHVLLSLNAGLFIFFVLSGYLVSRGFMRSLVLGTPAPSLPRYASSRLLRIVPAFWVALTATLVIEGTAGTGVGGIAAMYAFAQIYVVRPAFALIIQAWTL